MATASEVLEMLIPNGGWISTGQDYEGVQFLECEPISKKNFKMVLRQLMLGKLKSKIKKQQKSGTFRKTRHNRG